ncbi:MAG: DUF2889 domain-containing protein, partial [Smithellaceae bacterium]|nr:DUF2889 domain-containing protein [Smithellaceae bacterium]
MEKRQLIHSRKINIRTYETDGECVIVEGSLEDERLFPFIAYATDSVREAGVIHEMRINMTVGLPFLEISALDTQMPVIPDPGCL